MASTSKSKEKIPAWHKDRPTVSTGELCCAPEYATERCVWAISNGTEENTETMSAMPPVGRTHSRCKHTIVGNISCCYQSLAVAGSPCYKIRKTIDAMHEDLITAKKALKIYAFYRWISEEADKKESNQSGFPPAVEKSKAIQILDSMEDYPEFKAFRDKYETYFDVESKNVTDEGGYKEVHDYLEGGEEHKGDEFPGEIAKELNRMLRKRLKAKPGKKDLAIGFARSSPIGICHGLYCADIPISELPSATKVDLAGGWVIPEISWAFN